MKLRADLHIHSEYSFDSESKIEEILKKAKEQKLDIVAITDHEEFLGAERMAKLSKDLIIIKGEEIDTEYGDIVGLFLKKKIHTQKFNEVIQEIKNQNGLVLVPHPSMHHILIDEVLDSVDLIEVYNSRVGKAGNKMAELLSRKTDKPGVAGSDAHFLFEIGNGVTIINSKTKNINDIKKALLKGDVELERKTSPKIKRYWAKLVKLWRRR